MGRKKHCSQEKRELIRKLRRDGKSYMQIQNILGCSAKMVANALRWQPTPETRGRKRKTTSRQDTLIVRASKANPFASSTQLQEIVGVDVAPRTIRRRLKEAKLPARSPRKVPLLNKRHRKRRLEFAKEHIEWPLFKWRNILWSDESKIVLFGNVGRRTYVRRPLGTAYQPQYTIKTVKHGGSKIMVWACFSYFGVGPIFWIKNIMTASVYVEILQDVMLPYAEYEMPLKWVFMHDNDPKHSSRLCKQFLEKKKINVLNWPAQSPDLNPIENLWGDIKDSVAREKPKNQDELWAVIRDSWKSIPVFRCQDLVNSMPRRCEAVIANKGFTIKY